MGDDAYLSTREANSDNAELVAFRQEFWLNH
jgi:hypothetical protein